MQLLPIFLRILSVKRKIENVVRCLMGVLAYGQIYSQAIGISDDASFTPSSPLHIYISDNTNDTTELMRLERKTTGSADQEVGYIGFYMEDGSAGREVARLGWKSEGLASGGNGSLLFQTASNNSLQTHMVIDSGGNVGIGTNTPTYRFHVSSGAMGVDDISVDGIAHMGDSTYFGNGAGQYMMPQSKGDSGQVLKFDGTQVQWQDPSALQLTNSEGDNYVAMDQSDTTVNFYVDDTEVMQLNGSRLEPLNSGFSSYFGLGAGESDGAAKAANLYSVGIGYNALKDNQGMKNNAIGTQSLYRNETGRFNTAVGSGAGYSSLADYNVFIGNDAGKNTKGSDNVHIGYRSGYNADGSGNIYIGSSAGPTSSTTENDRLYIHNNQTNYPLIGGDFANNTATIHGTLEIWTPVGAKILEFPSSAGTPNQILQNNGSNELVWATLSNNITVTADDNGKVLSNDGTNTTWVHSYEIVPECPSGFVALGSLGCIQETEADYDGDGTPGENGDAEDEAYWEQALNYCFTNYNGTLPSAAEHAVAVNQGLLTELDNSGTSEDQKELVKDLTLTGSVGTLRTVWNVTTGKYEYTNVYYEHNFRCWIPK